MTHFRPHHAAPRALRPALLAYPVGLGLAAFLLSAGVSAQEATPKETVADGYAIHQSIDLGGRVVDTSGSGAMYDTLVNLQSGPRILSQSLDMHAAPGAYHPLFDDLTESSSGYGGDPYDVTALRMSKGKIYRFQGLFRRDRQYFDYDLLDNPLVPAGVISNGYTFPQVENSPHLFNTVRRMTDVGLTLFPISKLSFRTGYSHNTDEGPSFSSQHEGTEALYLQNWRNSTDTWTGAVDWKPVSKTMLTFEETVMHYKGDTNWELTGLDLQLANGTPVTLGFDNVKVPACTDGKPPIITSATTPPTADATCSGFLQYYRTAPTRTLFPTEAFRFQSASLRNVQMNGDVRYIGGTMNLPAFTEFFAGTDRGTREFLTTGYANAKRINVSADFGIIWQISQKFSLSDQYDFLDFRAPALANLNTVNYPGTSMMLPPGPAQAHVPTFAPTFLGMKTETNTATATWERFSRASVSLGYRYQQRFINWVMPLATEALTDGASYTVPIFENAGILGFELQPTRQWKVNAKFEASYDDRAYVQISPRQLYRYHVQSRYKPREWATITGTFHDLERRDNVTLVNHLDHIRSFSVGATLMPKPRYGLDVNYGYGDVFSQTTICYAATPAPSGPGAGAAPASCGTNNNLGSGYYDAPTQYGSFGFSVVPTKTVRSTIGYRISAVNGTTELLNPLEVPGSLRSQYQSPFANVAWTIHPRWTWKGGWNYYGYGEDSPVGPTAPRAFPRRHRDAGSELRVLIIIGRWVIPWPGKRANKEKRKRKERGSARAGKGTTFTRAIKTTKGAALAAQELPQTDWITTADPSAARSEQRIPHRTS